MLLRRKTHSGSFTMLRYLNCIKRSLVDLPDPSFLLSVCGAPTNSNKSMVQQVNGTLLTGINDEAVLSVTRIAGLTAAFLTPRNADAEKVRAAPAFICGLTRERVPPSKVKDPVHREKLPDVRILFVTCKP